jgi:hypothetical protein
MSLSQCSRLSGGLHGVLELRYALVDTETRRWAVLSDDQANASYPTRFDIVKVFITGKLPWRNILHYDMHGDEFYRGPHFYCEYADAGQPYEGYGYFIVREGYEWELRIEDKREIDLLLNGSEDVD